MSLARRLGHASWALALAAGLIAAAGAELLYRSGAAAGADSFYADAWHRLAGPRQPPRHVALVMIDDPSLNERPDEPLAFWTPHFARAIGVLREAGARLIVVDFIFSGSPERWIEKLGLMTREASRTYDRGFREQINRGGVLLAGFRSGTGDSADDFILPSPDYLLALPDLDIARAVGLANLNSDPDGVVRRFRLAEATGDAAVREGLPVLTLSALAAITATGQPRAGPWRFGDREFRADALARIAFPGPPGSFKALSFASLLRANALYDPAVKALAGKVVVIGAGYAGMNDVHPTPYSTSLAGANRLMSGPEIQAAIIETLLSGREVGEAGPLARLLLFAGLLVGVAAIALRLSIWRAMFVIVGAGLVTTCAAYLAFLQGVLLPLAHLHAGLVLVLIGLALLRLTREERERERIGQVFGRYVSSQVMSALLASPSLPELGGQARRITVLFSDIRGFTGLSEQLTAPEVVELLNTYFERACAVLLAEGATIDKFIGDAIMAEFGAPLTQPDHARRAVRAALALRAVAIDFRQWMAARFPGRDLPEFDVGIGLHSGEAVVGNVGSSARMEFTAIGDTVNIASRLEGLTKTLGCAILASADTVRLAGDGIRSGAHHVLAIRGRQKEIEAVDIHGLD